MSERLSNLLVLGLDCQATHPDPEQGHLLEMGWLFTRASSHQPRADERLRTFLIEISSDGEIPRHVQKVTGISRRDLEGAVNISDLATELARDMAAVRAANGTRICPVVIHYSRFEQPFLRAVTATGDWPSDAVFEILCTHEIVKRVLPDLPRRGLRAVAGFFGHSVPEQRRAGHHAVATAWIWRSLVQLLQESFNISTLGQLRDWIKDTPGEKASGFAFPMRRRIRLAAPSKPGIYRMRRCNGDLLYVGKAASLKKRVNSYFQRKKHHPEHILEMLAQATQLDTVVTGSALEAALLESDEIKAENPPYNILLREGERRLLFASRDLQQISESPDKRHLLGPLVGRDSNLPLSRLTILLSEPQEPVKRFDPGLVLGLPAAVAPNPDCLEHGIRQFRSRYPQLDSEQGRTRFLLKLGVRLWQLRRVEAEEEQAIPEDSSADQVTNWDPDRVCRVLEEVVIWGSHAVRRARWLCALSESMVSWSSRTDSGRLRHLVVAGGRVTRAGRARVEKNSSPACDRVPLLQRQNHFDLATYDRLLVLTGELRRLLRQGRSVQIRISPRRVLEAEGLMKVLAWL
jgi:DNA polymerase-3 subunit epsilon